MESARRTYTPGDRRRQVRAWLAHVGSLRLAHAGPVHFVPDTAMGLIQALQSAQTALGLQVWAMPVHRSGDVIATLTQSLDAEITQQTTTLLRTIQAARQGNAVLSTSRQAQLVGQLHDLSARVHHYADLFGTQLDQLTQQLDLAKQAVRSALTP
ncbi:MAG: hypothetical protein C7B47_14070 [Sulfobacillus thermosulfidooxidans]|uniref:Uncharacterized protein n=1 Tax=Sulfobacillus thermosulfidooxidans TaxID=28034 RepID=A0A2T2WR86_SULTH|nr:MAG: hypothetical protein C7B47_14070 [Sulfobacillus thermosulfidooxidans]